MSIEERCNNSRGCQIAAAHISASCACVRVARIYKTRSRTVGSVRVPSGVSAFHQAFAFRREHNGSTITVVHSAGQGSTGPHP